LTAFSHVTKDKLEGGNAIFYCQQLLLTLSLVNNSKDIWTNKISISSTFYASLFRMKVICATFI